jgi:NTP pyrophosphatase (non-canonical NTP hydrolase)
MNISTQLESKFLPVVYDIDEYATEAKTTAIYPECGTGSEKELSYLAMGLVSEAGEVAGKVKKLVRDGKLDREALSKELGDVFWYLAMLSLALNKNPSKVLTENLIKLRDRMDRGAIAGNGDER